MIRELMMRSPIQMPKPATKIPLRLVLVVPFVLQLVGAVTLTTYLYYRNQQQAVDHLAERLITEVNNQVQLKLDQYLTTPPRIAQMAADASELGLLDLTNLLQAGVYFWRQKQIFQEVGYIGFGTPTGEFAGVLSQEQLQVEVLDRSVSDRIRYYRVEQSGRLLKLARTKPAYEFLNEPWYQNAVQAGKPLWSDIYQWTGEPILAISFSYPVYNRERQLLGVISVDNQLRQVSEFLRTLSFNRSGRVFIVERSGNLVASSSDPVPFGVKGQRVQRMAASDSQDPLIRAAARALAQRFPDPSQMQPSTFKFDVQGQSQFLSVESFRDSYGLDWLVVVVIPEANVIGPIDQHTQTTILLGMTALAVAIALGLLTASWVARPILRLSRASRALAMGESLPPIDPESRIAELEILSRSFNVMTAHLQASLDRVKTALQESEEKFTKVFRSSPDAISIEACRGHYYLEVNDSFLRVTGFSRDEVIGRTALELNFICNLDQLQSIQRLLEADPQRVVRDLEFEFRTKAGQRRTALLSLEILDLEGQPYLLSVFRDISDRKQLELALQRSEAQLHHILNSAIAGIACFRLYPDKRVEYDYLSAGCEAVFGYTARELMADVSLWRSRIHPEDWETRLAPLQLTSSQGTVTLEYRFYHKDGALRWIRDYMNFRWEDSAQYWQVTALAIDISDRKWAEEKLQNSEAALREAQRVAHIGSWEYDPIGETVIWSEELFRIHGLDPSGPPPSRTAISNLIHPGDRSLYEKSVAQAVGERETHEYDIRIIRPDKTLRHLQVRTEPICDAQGQLIRIVGTVLDITERKQAEAELQLAHQQLASHIENAPFATIIWDQDLRVRRWSKQAENIFGWKESEVLGKHFLEWPFVYEEDIDRICQRLEQPLTDQQSWAMFLNRNYTRDGAVISCAWYNSMQYDESGQLVTLLSLVEDVTERKRTEAALRRSEATLRQITDALPVYISYLDRQQRYQFVNRMYEERFQCSREQLRGKTIREVLGDAGYQVIQYYLEQALAGNLTTYTIAQPDPQGGIRQLEVTLIPDFGEGSQVIGCYSLVIDITARRQAEEALRQSEQRFRSAFDTTAVGTSIVSLEGRFLMVNPSLCQMLGYSESELLRLTIADISPPEDAAMHLQYLQRLLNGEIPYYHLEKRDLHKDGHAVWILLSVALVRDSQQQPLYFVSQAQDITSRKQAEAELKAQQTFLRQVFDIAPGLLFVKDEEGRVLAINQAGAAIFGMTAEEIIGKLDRDFVTNSQEMEQFLAINQQVMRSRQPIVVRAERITNPQGELRWYQTTVNPFIDAEGQVHGVIGSATDITDLIRVEEELRQAKEAAEAASKAKSAFLLNMSHELRTPLNAILGFTELMLNADNLTASQRSDLMLVNRSGEHLLDLINEVLDLSKIEAERMTLDEHSFDLHQLLREIREMLAPEAIAKDLQLAIGWAWQVPQFIRTDPKKLRQVLLNLLGNAIKFTQTGTITLRVDMAMAFLDENPDSEAVSMADGSRELHQMPTPAAAAPSSSQPVHLYFQIDDTGFGIAPDELATLFTPFTQTESGRRSHQGTGLGLSISRKFVQLMGGDITVKSKLGVGSSFQFDIQAQLAEPPPGRAPALNAAPPQRVVGLLPGQPAYRILVVDDVAENRGLLVRLLASVGFEVQEAADGQTAIDLWAHSAPHLIWLDTRLPGLDGRQVAQQIRAIEQLKAQPGEAAEQPPPMRLTQLLQRLNPFKPQPIDPPDSRPAAPPQRTVLIAFSASITADEQQRLLAAGCDDFVAKPCSEATIFDVIGRYLGVQYTYEDSLTPAPEPSQYAEAEILEALAAMPEEWVQQVRFAAQIGDDEEVLRLLEHLPETQSCLAEALSDLARDLHLDRILALTQR